MKLQRGGGGACGGGDYKTPKVILLFFPWIFFFFFKESFLEKAVNFFYTNLVKMTSAHSQIRTIKMKTSEAQTQTGPPRWETSPGRSQIQGPCRQLYRRFSLHERLASAGADSHGPVA